MRLKLKKQHKLSILAIASVWLINGLYCKVLGFVPRHMKIVSVIFHVDFASAYLITFLIGILEILMALWIISGYKQRTNATIQIVTIASMNILELIYVPELLLWGKLNVIFAILFMAFVYRVQFSKDKITT